MSLWLLLFGLAAAAALAATPPADVQRVQVDTRTGTPGRWTDLRLDDRRRQTVAGWLDADAAATRPATPPPAPPPPPADEGARRVAVGQAVGPIKPGERVLIQAGWRRAETIRPAAGCYVGRYGEGPNPCVTGGASVVFQTTAGGTLDDVTVEDLDVVDERGIAGEPAFDPKRPDGCGWQVASPVRGLAVRRCSARGHAYGFCVSHTADVLRARNQGGTIEDFRACDNWSAAQIYYGQGLYLAAWDDLTILRPVVIGNGYVPGREADPGGFSHGIYGQGGLTQWKLPEGCRRLRVIEPVAIHNAAWGVQNRSDGGEVSGGFFAGNAVGLAMSGPLPVRAVGDVVVAGHVCQGYAGQRFGAGGIDWRAAGGELRDTLLVRPPECRPANKDWRKPAYEPNAAKRTGPADATYVGRVAVTAGGNNVCLGWEKDVTVWGSAVPGLTAVAAAPAADWGWLDDYERRARAGHATAAEAVQRVRTAAGR